MARHAAEPTLITTIAEAAAHAFATAGTLAAAATLAVAVPIIATTADMDTDDDHHGVTHTITTALQEVGA